ncbi:MAG: hypothetical protein V2A61_00675, partial [Calditrichota bacterium]
MTPDWLVFLSGRVPWGIWVVPGAGLFFTIVWITVWRGTGFYTRRKFIRLLVGGWLFIVIGYSAAWLISPPPAPPLRIIIQQPKSYSDSLELRFSQTSRLTDLDVSSYVPSDDTSRSSSLQLSISPWRAWIATEELANCLRHSPRPFVLMRPEDNPALTDADLSRLDTLAPLLHPRWLIQINDTIYSSDGQTGINLNIYRWREKTFRSIAHIPVSPTEFRTSLEQALDSTVRILGEKPPASTPLSYPPVVGDDDLRDLWLGHMLAKNNLKDEAEAAFRELIAAHPAWVKPQLELARTMLENRSGERIEEIRQVLIHVIDLEPDNHESYLR